MQDSDDQRIRMIQAGENSQTDRPSFYSVAAVANIVGMSTDTIRRAIASEALPAYKIGSSVRVRYGDLNRWLEANRYRAGESVTQNATAPVATDFRW